MALPENTIVDIHWSQSPLPADPKILPAESILASFADGLPRELLAAILTETRHAKNYDSAIGIIYHLVKTDRLALRRRNGRKWIVLPDSLTALDDAQAALAAEQLRCKLAKELLRHERVVHKKQLKQLRARNP